MLSDDMDLLLPVLQGGGQSDRRLTKQDRSIQMPFNNTLRAAVLAGLIALGSAVSSDASTAANPLLSMVQTLVLEGAEIITSAAHRGLDGMSSLLREPWM